MAIVRATALVFVALSGGTPKKTLFYLKKTLLKTLKLAETFVKN